MNEYHKIQTLFKRDMSKPNAPIIEGDWTMPELEYLKDNEWVFTEKVDGTNIRVMWDGKQITFNGKSDDANTPQFLIDKLNEIFLPLPKRLLFTKMFGENQVTLYGEGYGEKIQNGGSYTKGQDFVLFDVFIDGLWLERKNVDDIAFNLGIKSVPIIGTGTLTEAIKMTRQGIKSQWGDFISEGIVARPRVELFTRRGERLITKIKHKDFK